MSDEFNDRVEDLARDLNEQGKDLRDSFFLSFIYTSDLVNKYLDRELRKYGYNRTLMNILNNLVTHNGFLTPTEIGQRVCRADHAITRAIDILEKKGLITKEHVDTDRRQRKIIITHKGLDVVKESMQSRRIIAAKIIYCLDRKESEVLGKILKKLKTQVLRVLEE